MKITTIVQMSLKIPQAQKRIKDAIDHSLRNVVSDIANDAIKGSPIITGNNRRSIRFEVGPGGQVARREGEGAIYSTSGYGGYLETGTVNMPAQPYFKPALDKNFHKLPDGIRAELK